MLPIALLFPGQGAQTVGMGRDLRETSPAAAALFAEADRTLNRSLTQIMWEGPEEELMRTANCQPALFVHGLAALAALRERLGARTAEFELAIVGTAGLSLGELTAHAAAGTFDFADGLRLVERRGELMEVACRASEGGMVALIGGTAEAAEKLAEEAGVQVANYNTPGQYVLSGTLAGTQKAAELAKAHGFRRAAPLKVAGAYHSRLMQPAQTEFATSLAEITASLRNPRVPVVANFSAEAVREAARVPGLLGDQVTGSVRWEQCVKRLAEDCGAKLFLELGPGATLAGMVPRIVAGADVISIGDAASLAAAVAKLEQD